MSLIATSKLSLAGTKPNFTAAAAGDLAKVGPTMFLVVKNGAGSDINVTIAQPGNQPSGAPNDAEVIPVVAGSEAWIPLETFFANPVDGYAHISYSSITTITRAVVRR